MSAFNDESATTGMDKLDLGMSNFDQETDPVLAKALRAQPGEVYARYAGWHFNARVWFQRGRYRAEVWTNGYLREVISAWSLKGIMRKVSRKYGAA